jgi:hypothetical protein
MQDLDTIFAGIPKSTTEAQDKALAELVLAAAKFCKIYQEGAFLSDAGWSVYESAGGALVSGHRFTDRPDAHEAIRQQWIKDTE